MNVFPIYIDMFKSRIFFCDKVYLPASFQFEVGMSKKDLAKFRPILEYCTDKDCSALWLENWSNDMLSLLRSGNKMRFSHYKTTLDAVYNYLFRSPYRGKITYLLENSTHLVIH